MRRRLKNNIKHIILLATCFLEIMPTQAQDSTQYTLSKDEFLSIVRQYHPMVRKAQIGVEKAKAAILENRGDFDPKIGGDYSTKTFGGKGYYQYFNPEVVIPTWFGIDLKGGIENVSGAYTNPEYGLGKTSYIGLKTNLQQLIFDKRRAALQQAKSLHQLSKAEQELAINDLLYDALAAYWQWVKSYEIYQLVTEALQISQERLRFVKIEYQQGAKPAIDTTEAWTQVQSFDVMAQAAWLDWQNAGLEMSNYLWLPENEIMPWHNKITPKINSLNEEAPSIPLLHELLSKAATEHPKLKSLDFKQSILQYDKRLKTQYLLPKLSVSANALNKGYQIIDPSDQLFLENNHKIAVDLSIPLFMRQARGALKQAKLKLEENKLQQNLSAVEISNKIKSYHNELSSLQAQVASYQLALQNYQKLYQGENTRFNTGESTLFVMNARQNKLLEAAQKLIELKAKFQKSYAALYWAAAELD